MEFDKLGRHCEHDNCNQKDFLPFTCDKCRKSLCFLHRSEYAHDCVNKDMNDMTSMDCPVCKKSFKLTKAEDPNEAWDRHFSTTCTQIPGGDKQSPLQCAEPTCKVILGPSNRFQCPQCRLIVCLGCRTFEAHHCTAAPAIGLKRGQNAAAAARFNKFSGNSSNSGGRTSSSNTQNNASKSKSKSSVSSKPSGKKAAARNTNSGSSSSSSSSDNTLKGSAQRRMEQQQQQQQQQRQGTASTTSHQHQPVGVVSPPTNSSESFDCPLCFQKYQSSAELVQHVDRAHNAPQPSVPSSVSTANRAHSSPVAGGEVCPTCSQRFSDVMELIQHAEREHAGLGEGSSSNSTSSGSGGQGNCHLS